LAPAVSRELLISFAIRSLVVNGELQGGRFGSSLTGEARWLLTTDLAHRTVASEPWHQPWEPVLANLHPLKKFQSRPFYVSMRPQWPEQNAFPIGSGSRTSFYGAAESDLPRALDYSWDFPWAANLAFLGLRRIHLPGGRPSDFQGLFRFDDAVLPVHEHDADSRLHQRRKARGHAGLIVPH